MNIDFAQILASLKIYSAIALVLIVIVDTITEYIKKALSLDGKKTRIVLLVVSILVATAFSILASIIWYYAVLLWLCLMAISGGCFDLIMKLVTKFGEAMALLNKK